MPYLQVTSLIVKESLPSQLHTEDKQAEQLRQSSAEDIEPEVHLKAVSQIGERILPERAMLVGAVDLAIQFPHSAVVDGGTRQQTIKFHGLNG